MMIVDRLEFYWRLHATLILLFGSLIFASEIDSRLGVLGGMRRHRTGVSGITKGARLELVIVLAVILLAELSVWVLPMLDASDLQNAAYIWILAALFTTYSFGVILSPGALSSLAGSNNIYREGTLLFCIVLMLIIDWGSALRPLTSWSVVLYPALGSAIAVIGYASPRIGNSIAAALSKTAKAKQD